MAFELIPGEMRIYPQWIVWRFEDVEGQKPTKVPYNARTGRKASVSDPTTWTSFEQAVTSLDSGMYSGLGFVLTEDDPFGFIDLDDPFERLPNGNYKHGSLQDCQTVMDRQLKIYNEFESYAERSPSGNGLHIIIKGKIESGRKRSSVEVYSQQRFMTMTGNVYRDLPINDYSDLFVALWQAMAEGKVASMIYGISQPQTMSDDEIIGIALNAANGDKFRALLDGNWRDYYQSQSEADFAFVDIIAFYSKNAEQVKRIFAGSKLGERGKKTTINGVDYVSHMVNRSFDHMLPPVDIEGLQNQLNEILEKRAREERPAASEDSNATPAVNVTAELPELSKDVYSVPPGLVGELAQFIYSQAVRPVPEIALAGALGLMAGIVGRAYNVSNTGLNQYVLLLAETGAGKEAIASGVDKLMSHVVRTVPAATEFIGPGEIASAQALIKYMAKSASSFVSMVGEFGIYLQQMASVNAAPHLMGLRRMMLDLYNKSGEGKVLRPSIYSDKDKNTTAVQAPSFTLLGESTPEKFYEGLHEGMISEGLLPRFLVIEYHGQRPDLNDNHVYAQPSFELIDRLSTVCAHALMLNSQHKAIAVQQDAQATAIFKQFNHHCDMNIRSADREVRRHLWNRAHIKALKLAALVAVGNHPYDPTINADVATWAINLVVADVRNMLARFDAGEIGVDNDETKQLAKAVSTIKDYVVSPWSEVAKYAGESAGRLHQEKIIAYSYIQRRLASVAVFRKDRQGATGAIKRTLKTLTERGDLQEVSRATLAKDYGTSAVAYMIANPKAFAL